MSASAAAGKNPWLPLAIILLVAQADSVPSWLIDPHLHRGLHSLGEPGLLLGLGLLFLVLAVAESFADKVSWIESWLTPISTAWRPFAAIAVSVLVGFGALEGQAPGAPLAVGTGFLMGTDAIPPDPLPEAGSSGMSPYAWLALCIAAGTATGLIATIGKTGTRLLLTLVPVPGIRVAHSFIDDLFAWGVTFAGMVLGDSVFMLVLGGLYLGVGFVTAPILARLSAIQLRIFGSLWRKHFHADAPPPKPPRWLSRALPGRNLDALLPAYAYRTRTTGLCRGGFVIVDEAGVTFAARSWFGAKVYDVPAPELVRLGLAETLTSRALTLARPRDGHTEECTLYLFPGTPAATSQRLSAAAKAAGLVRVRVGSESARLPHEAAATAASSSARFAPASRAGNLRSQALVTLAAALVGGIMSGGVFVPIGFGYVLSPFKGRFLVALLLSSYLAASVLGTFGFAWPIALLYACVLNAVALRDLSRHALKARLDGYVDTHAFLPCVPGAVWVTSAPARDHFRAGQEDPVTDGSWRVVWRLLSAEPTPA